MNPGNKMRINKFVLDNNIWVSYFITKKKQKLLEIINKHELTVFSCDELVQELRTVLNYPHLKKFEINVSEAVRVLRSATIHFKITYPIKRYVPLDENDDYLKALALQTSSGFITSGDSDILSEKANLEKKYKKLKIITKTEFERMFG
ncbi:MAG TPA: putative toxin-antitoxin system toxin component, PIN family [Puia sp.]|nr:putative toxin-antitoxin system toxin component, PIN family [Puia sp.]